MQEGDGYRLYRRHRTYRATARAIANIALRGIEKTKTQTDKAQSFMNPTAAAAAPKKGQNIGRGFFQG